MISLVLTSLQAANADPTIRAIADYLTRALSLPVRFADSPQWQERERLLDSGQAQMAWLSGLAYVEKRDAGVALKLLAAPVMAARGAYIPLQPIDQTE